jgi:hypothetical protein
MKSLALLQTGEVFATAKLKSKEYFAPKKIRNMKYIDSDKQNNQLRRQKTVSIQDYDSYH